MTEVQTLEAPSARPPSAPKAPRTTKSTANLGEGFAARVLSVLSEHQRIALRLRHGEGLLPEQVAARMKLPQGVTDRLLADAERTLQAARRAFVEALVEHSAARD
jgi:DNA-directed RNA polymerase specialized sigma24 family protein